MFTSFRSRLVLSNLLITLVGLLLIGIVFTGVLTSRNEDIKKTDLAADSRLVAGQVEALYQAPDVTSPAQTARQLKQIVNGASRALQVRVILLSPEGKIKADSQLATPYDTGSWHPADFRALKAAENARKELSNGKVLFQSPIKGAVHPNGGAVLLVATVSDVRPSLLSLSGVILIVLATLLVVWLALGLYFTFSISRPLLRISAATRRMARGDYAARVPAMGNGEIARLATDFNAMAHQIQQSDQVLKDFVANVSHDLRTPLTVIGGFAQAILDGTVPEEETRDSARIIHEETVGMQRMVEDLLELTRLESGLLTFRREPLQVRQFVQTVVDRTVRATAETPSAEIRNVVPLDLPMIDVDREQLERALRNLLNNALQYTPADGTVTVAADAIGKGWVEIRVSDTGAGIPHRDLSRVFERFYRTNKSRGGGHSGLGLAIVREIVEAHGGKVSVESTQGKGTTFSFTAPQARAPSVEPEAATPPDSLRQPATR